MKNNAEIRKAAQGSNQAAFLKNHLNTSGNQKTLNAFEYKAYGQNFQCKNCHSDYEKFQIGGFCIDCQQRAEFVKREHPHIINKLRQEVAV